MEDLVGGSRSADNKWIVESPLKSYLDERSVLRLSWVSRLRLNDLRHRSRNARGH